MDTWVDPQRMLPDEKESVTVRVRGAIRAGWYRIADRWYALEDLGRWKMKTSRYWHIDRSWYLETSDIEAWRPEQNSS